MKPTEFYLTRRDAEDLAIGSPEAIYRAYPQIGVFVSEEKFIEYLANPQYRDYGPSIYLGIKGERMLATPMRIGSMNYEIAQKSDCPRFSIAAMTPGQMGYLVGGAYDGHLVLMLEIANERMIVSLNNPSVQYRVKTASSAQVRLLDPGEEVIIKGI